MDDIFERSDLDERAATDEQDVMNKKNRSDGSGSDDPGSADSGSGYTGFVTIESNDSGSDRAGTGVNGTDRISSDVYGSGNTRSGAYKSGDSESGSDASAHAGSGMQGSGDTRDAGYGSDSTGDSAFVYGSIRSEESADDSTGQDDTDDSIGQDGTDDSDFGTEGTYASVEPEHRQYHSKYDSYRFQTPTETPPGDGPDPGKKRSIAVLLIAAAAIIVVLGTVSVLAYSAVTGESILTSLRSSLSGKDMSSNSREDKGPREEIVLGRPREEVPPPQSAESALGEAVQSAGQGAYMGITCLTMPEDYTANGYPVGVYVLEVTKDGPADRAGILEGDILTELDGIALETKEMLVDTLSTRSGGDQAVVRVSRFLDDERASFEKLTLTVTLGDRDELKEESSISTGSGESVSEDAQNALAEAEDALSAAEEEDSAALQAGAADEKSIESAAEDAASPETGTKSSAAAAPAENSPEHPEAAESMPDAAVGAGSAADAESVQEEAEKSSERSGGIPGADYR